MQRSRPTTTTVTVVAAALPLAVCAVLSLLRDRVSSVDAALVLVVVVVGVAAAGYRLAGVVAAVASAICFDFFLTEPYFRFTIDDRDDVETAVLLTITGLIVTEIALWGRRQQAGSSRRGGYLDGLVAAANLVASGEAAPSVAVGVIADQIADVLGVDTCVFEPGPARSHPRLLRDGTIAYLDQVVDVDRSGFPTFDVVEIPVQSGGEARGRFVLTASSRVVWPSIEQRRVAVTLADQAGAALGTPRQRQG